MRYRLLPPKAVVDMFDIVDSEKIEGYERWAFKYVLKNKQHNYVAFLAYNAIDDIDDPMYVVGINDAINSIADYQRQKIQQLSRILQQRYSCVYNYAVIDLKEKIREMFTPDVFEGGESELYDAMIRYIIISMETFEASSKLYKILRSLNDQEINEILDELYGFVYRITGKSGIREQSIDIFALMKIKDLKQLNVIGETWGMGGTYKILAYFDLASAGIDGLDDYGFSTDPPNIDPLEPEIQGTIEILPLEEEGYVIAAVIPFITML